jgi:hypothetical protein
MAGTLPPAGPESADPAGWAADVDALLAERARAGEPAPVVLPTQLSVSALVDLDRDREAAARRLTRRLPARPSSRSSGSGLGQGFAAATTSGARNTLTILPILPIQTARRVKTPY